MRLVWLVALVVNRASERSVDELVDDDVPASRHSTRADLSTMEVLKAEEPRKGPPLELRIAPGIDLGRTGAFCYALHPQSQTVRGDVEPVMVQALPDWVASATPQVSAGAGASLGVSLPHEGRMDL